MSVTCFTTPSYKVVPAVNLDTVVKQTKEVATIKSILQGIEDYHSKCEYAIGKTSDEKDLSLLLTMGERSK